MCNRYTVALPYSRLAEYYDATQIGSLELDGDILPRNPGSPAPSDNKRTLNNARIESAGKWPWKDAFKTTRCILPLHEFREPCYWGETAGTEVYFHHKDRELLHVAGIYLLWRSPDGKEKVLTMAFLMRPACEYVMDHGHHRQPLFISGGGIDEWLTTETLSADEALEVLRHYVAKPSLTYRHAREMAPGWKSRQKKRLKSRGEQLQALEKAPSALGF